MLKELVTKGIVIAGLASTLSACDTAQKIELATRKYEGPVEIQLYRDVISGNTDLYVLKILDKDGNSLASMTTNWNSRTEARVNLGGKIYDLRLEGIIPEK